MAALTLADLTTPMTREEVRQSIYRALGTVGVSTTSWKSGAVVRTIVAILSAILAAFSELMAAIAKSGFLELAEGPWLTLVARYVFGVDRIEATFAAGQVTLNNAGGGVYDFAPNDLIVQNPTTHKTYTNTVAVHVGALQVGVPADIVAVEAGAASTSTPGTITALVTTAVGVTCTNAGAVVGLDAELDPALRIRCYEKTSSLSPDGPREAYSFIAKGAKRQDGTLVGVTRVRVSPNSTTGIVTVTVAGASGAISGTVGDPATDLGAVNKAIQESVVPLGLAAAIVQSATALAIAVTYEVWISQSAALTNQQVQDLVAAAYTSFITGQPIAGNIIAPATTGKVYLDAIRTVIGAARRPEIFHVLATVPAADVDIAATQVPTVGTITCTAVHQEAG